MPEVTCEMSGQRGEPGNRLPSSSADVGDSS